MQDTLNILVAKEYKKGKLIDIFCQQKTSICSPIINTIQTSTHYHNNVGSYQRGRRSFWSYLALGLDDSVLESKCLQCQPFASKGFWTITILTQLALVVIIQLVSIVAMTPIVAFSIQTTIGIVPTFKWLTDGFSIYSALTAFRAVIRDKSFSTLHNKSKVKRRIFTNYYSGLCYLRTSRNAIEKFGGIYKTIVSTTELSSSLI